MRRRGRMTRRPRRAPIGARGARARSSSASGARARAARPRDPDTAVARASQGRVGPRRAALFTRTLSRPVSSHFNYRGLKVRYHRHRYFRATSRFSTRLALPSSPSSEEKAASARCRAQKYREGTMRWRGVPEIMGRWRRALVALKAASQVVRHITGITPTKSTLGHCVCAGEPGRTQER